MREHDHSNKSVFAALGVTEEELHSIMEFFVDLNDKNIHTTSEAFEAIINKYKDDPELLAIASANMGANMFNQKDKHEHDDFSKFMK
jgi:hypothetical protein